MASSPGSTGRTRVLGLLSLLIGLWAAGAAGWPDLRWRIWERNLEQQLLLWRGPRPAPRRVVVVAIDDATLQQAAWLAEEPVPPPWSRGLDTLPWPREAYGRLSSRLLEAGAAAVAINVVFEGPSGRGDADDAGFAALLARQKGRVALAAEMLEPEDVRGIGALTLVMPQRLLAPLGGRGALGLSNILVPKPGETLLHPEAYARTRLRAEGVVSLPALSTTLLRLAGLPDRQPDARMGLNVYGGEGSIRQASAWEVLDPDRWRDHPLREGLKGALVLVGPIEGGRHITAFGPLSGLELLATATANSLQGDGLLAWPEASPARALLVLAIVLAAAALALQRRALAWRLGVLAGVSAAVLGAALAGLVVANRWLPLLSPGGGLALLALLYGGDAYALEGRERRRLRRTFERYVAPAVVAEILSDPEAAQGILRGRILEVTVLFSDLQGFTQLTRRRSAAGESELHVRQLNAYLGAMVEVISSHGGTVDKFIGDAVMAVFGSPVGRGVEAEAQAAVRCALAMGVRLQQLNAAWQQEGLEPLASGVGLASGSVMTGQIGSPQRLDFTVIGDTVNLASRLESLTRQLACSVCVDTRTAALVEGQADLQLRACGPQEIKGLGRLEVFAVTAGV